MPRSFSLEQVLPPPVVTAKLLQKIENELQHSVSSGNHRFAKYQFSITDNEGIETFDGVSDDSVPLRLKQARSVGFLFHSEEEELLISLDIETVSGGDATLKIQMPGSHARDDALQLAARIREMTLEANAGAPGEQRIHYVFQGMRLPSTEFSAATAKALKDVIIDLCSSFCDVDRKIIRVGTEMSQSRGITFQNIAIAELERVAFPADIGVFRMTCECEGISRALKVELEFGRKHVDTRASIAAAGADADGFALRFHRDIVASLQRYHSKHGLLFVAPTLSLVLFTFSWVIAAIAMDLSSNGSPFAIWLWLVVAAIVGYYVIGRVVPYTQFDNSSLKRRVSIVNWVVVAVVISSILKGAMDAIVSF